MFFKVKKEKDALLICEKCKYFMLKDSYDFKGEGKCRRFPPILGYFTDVFDKSPVCGEFKPKDN